jgi:hypothetical protein
MAWNVSDKEFESVVSLSAERRYEYLLKRTGSHGEVWSLPSADGWVLGEDAGQTYFPIWPHPRFAGACAFGAWADATAHAIDVDDFALAWTKELEDDGLRVAVFPTPDTEGTGVSPARFHRDLSKELEQYG